MCDCVDCCIYCYQSMTQAKRLSFIIMHSSMEATVRQKGWLRFSVLTKKQTRTCGVSLFNPSLEKFYLSYTIHFKKYVQGLHIVVLCYGLVLVFFTHILWGCCASEATLMILSKHIFESDQCDYTIPTKQSSIKQYVYCMKNTGCSMYESPLSKPCDIHMHQWTGLSWV